MPELNPQPLPPGEEAWKDPSTAPPWWPQLLWQLHFPVVHPPGPGPINFPPAIENIMANLHIHTMSYLMADAQAAQRLRQTAEQQLVHAAQNLSKSHDEAMARKVKA